MTKLTPILLSAGLFSTSFAQVLGSASLNTPTRSASLGTYTPSASLGTPPTCTPTIVTAIHTETYTRGQIPITTAVTSLAIAAHSCYTYTDTVTVICDNTDIKCPPVPQCIRLETTTLTVPCADKCCPVTTTATTKKCRTCQTGCATITETVTSTQCKPNVTGGPVATASFNTNSTPQPTSTRHITLY